VWAVCPCKGVVSYYTVQVNGVQDANAAWTYRHPWPLAGRIKNHVAFCRNVLVVHADQLTGLDPRGVRLVN